MFALSAGCPPAGKLRASLVRAAFVVVLAALGGCASNQSTASYASGPAATPRVAQAASQVEADGRPAQTPPPASIRTEPDDPSEPYSRNYGGVNPSATFAPLREAEIEKHPAPKLPPDLPPAFHRKLVAAMNIVP